MTIKSTNDNNSTATAITYSECYAQVFSRLFLGDCLIESDKIESGSVDLILTDLPYGNMKNAPSTWDKAKTEWDTTIEPKDIYDVVNRILRRNGKLILFSQEPYTTRLLTETISNIEYSYRAIWEKDNFANALGCNKNMVSFTEDVLIFFKKYDTEINPIQQYLLNEFKKCGKQISFYKELCGFTGNQPYNWFSPKNDGTKQWAFPIKKHYLKIQQNTEFFKKPFEEIEEIDLNYRSTFNLWEGNKYKSNILKYKKDYSGHHPTQKPVLLLEDLIKTFSNENDLVVDLTMGSGSTGVACKNTKRNFIGIEKDENYFKIAEQRMNARTLFS